MELQTVQILSQNPELRGKYFDIYYYDEAGDYEIISVEPVGDANNLLASLDKQSIDDIKVSLKNKLLMLSTINIYNSIPQSELNASYVQAADENRLKGLSND